MRAIDSAISLANNLGQSLEVYWVRNKELNCPFSELFESMNGVHMVECNRPPFLLRQGGKANLFFPDIVRKVFSQHFYDSQKVKMLGDAKHSFSELIPLKNIRLASFTRFYPNPNIYESFVPVFDIRQEIVDETRSFNNHTVGVHIRRSDNVKSIQNSPIELFVERMKHQLNMNPLTNFYLASDDDSVKVLLKRTFGDALRTGSEPAVRNTNPGMRRAVVELFSLSKTQKVLGSHWSSFSHTACELSGIPEITVKK
ncbi:hypothetical protein [Dyadobacter arcticus]|uniref:Glycosyl transferase family 11 n=1 Tax=Dyadobacter arcticus TaxID=1078754 RepID=A0ABX0UPQ8_9BACT|nr:hypothetical protein [Dyadobacter arcticus]NIJ54976.1 hypothetical protein [Dyadobacter arcticus]